MNTNNIKTGLIKIPGALTSTGGDGNGLVGGVVAYTGDIYDVLKNKNQSDINKEIDQLISDIDLHAQEVKADADEAALNANAARISADVATQSAQNAQIYSLSINQAITNLPDPSDAQIAANTSAIELLGYNDVYDVSMDPDHMSGGMPHIYSNLLDALGTDGANIPSGYRHGGVTIKFIKSSQPAIYFVTKTEGVQQEPSGTLLQTAPDINTGSYSGSDLQEFLTLPTFVGASNSVLYYIEVASGTTTYTTWEIQLAHTSLVYEQWSLKYPSWSVSISDWGNTCITDASEVFYNGDNVEYVFDNTPFVENETNIDLGISDEDGNIIAQFKDGELETLNFDSKKSLQQYPSESNSDLDFSDEDGNIIASLNRGDFVTLNFDSSKTPKQTDSDNVFDISDEQGNVVVEMQNGHIRTKNFNSRSTTAIKEDSTSNGTFNISDELGNIIAQFKGGHIKTSKFDSSNININPSSNIIDGYTTIKSGMRLLFIGNSWSRDTVRLLWLTAKDAGVKDLKVYLAYLGGSSLYHQYIGMDDPTATYQHGTYTQYIQGTYQCWKYEGDKNGNLSLTMRPTNYNNGKCGDSDGTAYGKRNGEWAAFTLSQILQMEDWDIITISFQGYDLLLEDDWTENDSSKSYVDILSFINRIKQELSDDCLEKVEFGITSTWSIADGVTKDVTNTKALRYCNLTAQEWHNLSQSEKNEWYHRMYEDGQKNFQRIAKRMGNLCTYMVNTAKAFNFARKSVIIGDVGFGLHKSASDTHLAEGIPKYMCACLLCYEELGVKPQDFMDDYIAGGNPDVDTDGGSESTNPTRAQCVAAQKIAWAAYCDNYVVLD